MKKEHEKYLTEQLAGWKIKEFYPLIEILRTAKTKDQMRSKIFAWLKGHGITDKK